MSSDESNHLPNYKGSRIAKRVGSVASTKHGANSTISVRIVLERQSHAWRVSDSSRSLRRAFLASCLDRGPPPTPTRSNISATIFLSPLTSTSFSARISSMLALCAASSWRSSAFRAATPAGDAKRRQILPLIRKLILTCMVRKLPAKGKIASSPKPDDEVAERLTDMGTTHTHTQRTTLPRRQRGQG